MPNRVHFESRRTVALVTTTNVPELPDKRTPWWGHLLILAPGGIAAVELVAYLVGGHW